MRERFARCLVLRQRNQALHCASELARGNDEPWPDGFAGWPTARICLAPLAQPWVGGGSKLPTSATLADPGTGIAAAQQAGGGQGSIWSPIFQQAAPGAACFICTGSQLKSLRTGQRPQCPDCRSDWRHSRQ